MREIKYRAYCKSENKMYRVYGFSFYNIDAQALYGLHLEDEEENLIEINSKGCADFELLQFTGRLDKNGLTEIYEGDKLEIHPMVYADMGLGIQEVLVTNTEHFEYRTVEWNQELAKFEPFDEFNPGTEFIVIGNKFEHPELIKEQP